MKVLEKHPDRIILGGVPHGVGWPCFGLGLGFLFAGIFGWLCAHHFRNGQWYSAVMTALGAALGLLFIAVCGDILLQRERLELDRVPKRGVYRHWSLVRGEITAWEFPFERIAAVSKEKFMQASGGKRGFPTEALRTRLLLTRPRRAILLDETQNRRYARIEALANEIASFLGVGVRQMGRWDDDEEVE